MRLGTFVECVECRRPLTLVLVQLRESADDLRDQRLRHEQQARDAARQERLAAIAADPKKVIANIQKLVKVRSTDSYEEAARQLVDLREALGSERGFARARAIAVELRRENPRLNRLIAALRKHDLLD